MCQTTPASIGSRILELLEKEGGERTGEDLLARLTEKDKVCEVHFDMALRRLVRDGAIETAMGPATLNLPAGATRRLPFRRAPAAIRPFPPGTILDGRLEIIEEIARGGMAVVLRARHLSLEREVAVKMLSPAHLHPSIPRHEAAARFRAEALAIARIAHPHVIPIHDLGQEGEYVYYVMELLGETLAQKVEREGPLPWPTVLEYMLHLAEALKAASDQNILHRDVKPGNVLLPGPRLSDFGCAQVRPAPGQVSDFRALTQERTLIGTVQFMAPECAALEPGDQRSDQCSLGATMYYVLTGRLLHDLETGPEHLLAWMYAQVYDPHKPVLERRPDCPKEFADLIERTLSKRPENRYQSWSRLIADLKALLRRLPHTATESGARPDLTPAAGRPCVPGVRPGSAPLRAGSSVVSRHLGKIDLDATVVTLKYEELYGPGCFVDPNFATALHHLARERGILRICAEILARERGIEGIPDFEKRYYDQLRALAEGRETPEGPEAVSIDLRDYIWIAARQAAKEKDSEAKAARILLTFLEDVAEDPHFELYRCPVPQAAQKPEGVKIPTAMDVVERTDAPPDLPGTSGGSGPGTAPGVLPNTPTAVLRPTDLTDLIGQEIGSRRIVREIGRGGMGAVVFEALNKELERPEALKILGPAQAADEEFVRRFVREAKNAAKVDHPNVVQVYDAGRHGRYLWIAMQLVRGTTLKGVLQDRGRLGVEEALSLARQAAEGLAAAHEAGLIHRDIKPDNLMRESSGRLKILDFGLLRAVVPSSQQDPITEQGYFIGTPDYASPEQIHERLLDRRTDLYSLGVVLYELLSGTRPYSAESKTALLTKVADPQESPIPLRERNRAIPPEVESLVHRLLAKNPLERFASATELASAIDEVLPQTRKAGKKGRAKRWAVAAGLVLILSGLLYAVFFRSRGSVPTHEWAAENTNRGVESETEQKNPPETIGQQKDNPPVSAPSKNPGEPPPTGPSKAPPRESPAAAPLPPPDKTEAAVPPAPAKEPRPAADPLPSKKDLAESILPHHVPTKDELALLDELYGTVRSTLSERAGYRFAEALGKLETLRQRPGRTAWTEAFIEAERKRVAAALSAFSPRPSLPDGENTLVLRDGRTVRGKVVVQWADGFSFEHPSGLGERIPLSALAPGTFVSARGETREALFARAGAGDARGVLPHLSGLAEPDRQAHAPGIVDQTLEECLAAIEARGDVRPLLEFHVPKDLEVGFGKLLPLRLQLLAAEREAARLYERRKGDPAALRKLLEERSETRAGVRAAAEVLAAFEKTLPQGPENELVDPVVKDTFVQDNAGLPDARFEYDRTRKLYVVSSWAADRKAWVKKQLASAKAGYVATWKLAEPVGREPALGVLLSFTCWIHLTPKEALIVRQEKGGALTCPKKVDLPGPTAAGTLAVFPEAGLVLVYLNGRLLFALPGEEYALADGLAFGVSGGILELKSIRVKERYR